MTIIEARPGGLAAAAQAAQPGDTVVLSGGVYRERLEANRAGVTWKAADGERPVIDGGWQGDSLGPDKTGGPPLVALTAPGVRVEGIRVVNAPGFGVVITADNCRLAGCEIDNTYGSGIVVNGAGDVRGVVVEGNRVTRTVMRYAANGIAGGAGMVCVRLVDGIFRNNVVMGTWGEGFDIDRGSRGVLAEGNVIAFTAHLGIYIIRSVGTVLRGNVIFRPTLATEDTFRGKERNAPAGIVIGDEVSDRMAAFPNSSRSTVEGNLVVNCGILFQVRSNDAAQGYDTWLDPETRVIGNTFVGGPFTRAGVQIGATRPHGAAVFERNLVIMDGASIAARIAVTQGEPSPDLIWRNNGWSAAPPLAFVGTGALMLGRGALANAGAAISGTWQGADFDAANYRPGLRVPVGWGWRGRVEPEPPPPPPPPPPDEPPALDRAALMERAAAVGVQLATLAAAGNAAREQLAIMALAHESAADELAGLLTMLDTAG